MTNPNQPIYSWHVNLDRSLRGKARIAAIEQNLEVRELISDLPRKELKERINKESRT